MSWLLYLTAWPSYFGLLTGQFSSQQADPDLRNGALLHRYSILIKLRMVPDKNKEVEEEIMDDESCRHSVYIRTVSSYSKVSVIRPGCSRLLEFEKEIVLVV